MDLANAGRGVPGRGVTIAAAVLLAAALAFGGGSRGEGDLVVHCVAAPAFAVALLHWRHAQASRLQRGFLYLLAAAAAWMLVQLLPIPAAWFARLPGRGEMLHELDLAGVRDAWLAISLDPYATLRALLALLVFAASWMLATLLPAPTRERLLKGVLAAAFLMALLGFAQAAAGRYSALRPYDFHHDTGALGVFANRNHFADLMAMMIPFAIGLATQAFERGRTPAGTMLWSGATVVMFLAAALSYSRTGFALACLALVAGWWVQRGQRERTRRAPGMARWGMPLAVVASCAVAVAYYAWRGIVQRLDQDPLDDLRWQYLRNGLAAAHAHWPWGSGFGSFRAVYAPFEPVAEMVGSRALHAHDDLLEIAIEAGLPGIVLTACGVVLLAWAIAGALRRRSAGDRVAVAAAIATAIPLLHALVDYPLRTLAVAGAFGLVVAALLAPPGRGAESSGNP